MSTKAGEDQIDAPRDLAQMEVTIDDSAIAPTLFGTPIPVDPGAHVVRARAPRRIAFRQSFEAKEKETTRIEAVLAVDANAPAEPTTTVAASKMPEKPASRGGVGAWPWIVGGVGVASLGGAAWMFVARGNALSELDGACPSHHDCPPEEQSAYDRGRRDALLGDVFLGVGVVAVTTSVLLFTLGGEKESAHPAPLTAIAISPLGVNVVGSF